MTVFAHLTLINDRPFPIESAGALLAETIQAGRDGMEKSPDLPTVIASVVDDDGVVIAEAVLNRVGNKIVVNMGDSGSLVAPEPAPLSDVEQWSDPGPFYVMDGAKAIGNRSPQGNVEPFQAFAEAETYAVAFCEAHPKKTSGVTIQGAYHLLRAIRDDGAPGGPFRVRWVRS
jgi:hypothetical protein